MRLRFLACMAALALVPAAQAQFTNKWLAYGALHNWYSEVGMEVEHGFVAQQQYGFRWPGLYQFNDMQAAKGLWIGAKNVRGPEGTTFPTRVVHIGPRVTGAGEFFPTQFDLVSRVAAPLTFVDGAPSIAAAFTPVDRVDETLKADRAIENTTNTLLGLTMKRRVLAFGHEYHDNYHIVEYTFTNTGNTDTDAEIELPNNTLQNVVFFWQWRWSVAAKTRYLIGNSTGWGINTMLDARGDGLGAQYGDRPDENFRAMFAWHGFFPDKAVSYNNIGGPIMREGVPAVNIAGSDTLGRLGAYQWIGAVVLHADTSPTNPADDAAQPRVMKYFDSDEPRLSRNDPFTESKMAEEYDFMLRDATDRHAFRAAGSNSRDDLPRQRTGPNTVEGMDGRSTSGGKSAGMGFGPYTIGPGQSVRIVMAEAAAGVSRDAAESIVRAYKALPATVRDTEAAGARITYGGRSLTKNEWVFTGRDSLFQTFRRAIANYRADYAIEAPPRPPKSFSVNSGGDRIQLRWDIYAGESPDKWEIYRSLASFDEPATLIATVDGGTRTYDDRTAQRGLGYFYYLQAVKGTTSGQHGVPAGRPLRSTRYGAQAYLPASLLRPAGGPGGTFALDAIRIVPNPFYLTSDGFVRGSTGATSSPRYDVGDQIRFVNLPPECTIRIFTELGEEIYRIDHTNGSGDDTWNGVTRHGQLVASGVYIALITVTADAQATDPALGRYAKGETTFLKFTVIR
jgi:hypothetical protein